MEKHVSDLVSTSYFELGVLYGKLSNSNDKERFKINNEIKKYKELIKSLQRFV